MSLLRLVRLGFEAEGLRLRTLMRRQALRVAYAVVAAVFLLCALIMVHVIGFILLVAAMRPLFAAVVVLGVDVVIACMLLLMARGSGAESASEREARQIRDRARQQVISTATTLMILPRVARLVGMERIWRLAVAVFGTRLFSKWRR